MDEATDLIRRFCTNGDQAAFRRFYQHESVRLWRFLVLRGCDHELAYDVVAEAFTRFIAAVCRDPSFPRAFLYRIALNTRIDFHRRAAVAGTAGEEAATEAAAELPTGLEVDLHRAMGKLYPDEQNLLLLRYWIGMTHNEIAGVLEMPAGTIRRQAAAALRKLRDLLGEDYASGDA